MKILLKLTSILLFTCFFQESQAQTIKISGSITDQNKSPLDYASVALIRLPDSTSVALQVTDKNGVYTFGSIKTGKYLIKALMVGYKKNQSVPFEIKDTSFQVPTIVLADQAINLKGINIVSKMPVIDQKADRVIVNVEKMNTAGDNALEVISRSPGVTLDKDDNIVLKGKSGINVMIDGKMSYMSGTELTTYLKSLPAEVLSKIELISNPPSSFDAAGTAGIINIQLKRNKLQGFNGNANIGGGYGKYEKIYGGVNLNYNIDKVSTYLRVNAGHYNSYNLLTFNRSIGNEQYNQENFWHPVTNSINITTGADYFMDNKNTLGIMLKAGDSPDKTNVNSNSVNYNAAGAKAGSVLMDNPQKNKFKNYALNLNYRLKTDTLGSELGIDADAVNYESAKNESFTNNYFDANENLIGPAINLRNKGSNNTKIYALKADYTWFLGKTLKLETGWKSSWVKSENDLVFDSLKTPGWINDVKRTNLFLYNENINAGYLSLNKSFKKLDVKIGIRGEQTIGNGNSTGSDAEIKRKYFKIFPTAFVSYKIDSANLVTVAYRKSINRPSYRSLNPFAFYSDPYTSIQGNPLLNPSYANSIEINYSLKNFRILTFSYSKSDQNINQVIYQNDITKESVTRSENLGNESNFYIATGSPFDIAKWWNNNTELSANYNKVKSSVQGSAYNAEKFSWMISTDNTFTLPKDYSLSLYAYYSAPSVSGLTKRLENYQINVGAKKTFWKKNATISVRFNDIFDTSKYKALLTYNNVNTYWQNEWESRKVSLNFSYKFGNMKIKTARNRRTGTSDEERRTGN